MTVSTTKLVIVAVLGGVALFLGVLVATFHLLTLQRLSELNRLKKQLNGRGSSPLTDPKKDVRGRTIAYTDPTKEENLYLWKKRRGAPHETHTATSAEGYWNQVKDWLVEWGDAAEVKVEDLVEDTSGALPTTSTTTSSSSSSVKVARTTLSQSLSSKQLSQSHVHTSLLEAARLGHSEAQHYTAVSLASGIWMTGQQESPVTEDFTTDSVHTSRAYLHWHMAAMDGHLEAAMALAHRMDKPSTCPEALPYYEAAANGIVDQLEASPVSRAKINPPMDRHVLPKIHMHGGTSSQLPWDSKPDETSEALQFYHLLSTRTTDPDPGAAYTLGHLHHYGLRGVPQNLTKALYYYEIAANENHWEAAGQAGKFHIWNMGVTKRNLVKAKKFFEMGAPFRLEGCQRRYQQALQKKGKRDISIEETEVTVCDHPSLNGLGLLHLFGIPMVLDINVDLARGYFQLAHQMGNMDASYNLAMLKLGYKTSWKNIVDDRGTESANLLNFVDNPNIPDKSDIIEGMRELASAAQKGHTQARHRLGMMLSKGVTLPGSNVVIKPDCKQALLHFRWMVNNASPILSQRTRMAYKQYTSGDLESSLRNYLLAAETGHTLSQVNAAFLLDQGVCLHLSPRDCRKASLRLWKAAAQVGDPEAALRVGDSYYYGSQQGKHSDLVQVILYPEKYGIAWLRMQYNYVSRLLLEYMGMPTEQEGEGPDKSAEGEQTCAAETDGEGTCAAPENEQDADDSDLPKAAHYYRLAAEKHKSPRAYFNLGYMHEWGLGLTQDFPLAKRHYDLAASTSTKGEADLAVQLALWSMNAHQFWVKFQLAWKNWRGEGTTTSLTPTEDEIPVPSVGDMSKVGEPVSRPQPPTKTRVGIILKHVMSWESLLILVLTYILSVLFQYRRPER